MKIYCLIVCVMLLLVTGAGSLQESAAPSAPPTPVSVFAELDGVWKGTFVGYDASGKELYRIQVRQEYETVSATMQKVRITDTMPDGTVITGEGENIARRRGDGSLDLNCIVRKSNGERVEHAGRIVRGPDDTDQIIWHSRGADRVETFREYVFQHENKTIYEINGMGRYDGTLMLMTGRYIKQTD